MSAERCRRIWQRCYFLISKLSAEMISIPSRLSERRHYGWHQFPARGGSRWRLWHERSNHVLHAPGAAWVLEGQPCHWMGFHKSAHITGKSAVKRLSVIQHTRTHGQFHTPASGTLPTKCLCLRFPLSMYKPRGNVGGRTTEKDDRGDWFNDSVSHWWNLMGKCS